jgi:hypothetical protein
MSPARTVMPLSINPPINAGRMFMVSSLLFVVFILVSFTLSSLRRRCETAQPL